MKALPNIVRSFDSWGAFVEAAALPKRGALPCQSDARERRRNNRSAWAGTESLAEALSLASGGFKPSIVVRMGATRARATQELAVPRETVSYDVAGDFVDVGAFVTGVPECMGRVEQSPADRRAVRIVASVAASAGISTETIERRGAYVLALVETLRAQGVPVELFAAASYSIGGGRTDRFHEIRVLLSRPDVPLAPEVVAFALAHPSMQRRLVFAVQENEDDETRRAFGFCDYYGYPRAPDLSGDIVVPELMYSDTWRDGARADAWLRDALARQGIETAPA